MPLNAVISGVHGYVPDFVLTNKLLETMVDTNDEWITSRTGIKERRILNEKGKATSDMVAEAIKGLLKSTNTKPEEIDLVIVATVTADMNFPDTANIACDKVGIKNAFTFDLSAACSGFLIAYTTGVSYIKSGMYKKVIVVGSDKMSSIVDYSDRTTCVIFGDGAGAVLLEPTEENVGFVDAVLKSDGSGRQYLYQKGGGSLNPASIETVNEKMHYLNQEGKVVFKYAVRGMTNSILEVMEKNNLKVEDIDWVVPHQANKRIIDVVAKSVGVPMDKVMMNIHKYGNTTAATIPLCLFDYKSKLKKGDKIILTSFGGGFTWGAIYLIWG